MLDIFPSKGVKIKICSYLDISAILNFIPWGFHMFWVISTQLILHSKWLLYQSKSDRSVFKGIDAPRVKYNFLL